MSPSMTRMATHTPPKIAEFGSSIVGSIETRSAGRSQRLSSLSDGSSGLKTNYTRSEALGGLSSMG